MVKWIGRHWSHAEAQSAEHDRDPSPFPPLPPVKSGVRVFANAVLDPLDVAAAHAFDFAAELQIPTDLRVIENAKAVHERKGPSDVLEGNRLLREWLRPVASGRKRTRGEELARVKKGNRRKEKN